MRYLHGTYRLADQLVFSLNLKETLNSLHSKLLSTETEQTLSFCLLMNPDESKHNIGKQILPSTYVVGPINLTTLSLEFRSAIISITAESAAYIIIQASLPQQNLILFS